MVFSIYITYSTGVTSINLFKPHNPTQRIYIFLNLPIYSETESNRKAVAQGKLNN